MVVRRSVLIVAMALSQFACSLFPIGKKLDSGSSSGPSLGPPTEKSQEDEALREAERIIKEAEEKALQSQPELRGKTARVGLSLGPGLALTWAHVGVLAALKEARIPVHAIVGLGFGALPAALYSRSQSVGDTEWSFAKLSEKKILPTRGLLSSAIEPKPVTAILPFLTEALKTKKASAIPFSCSYASTHSSEVVFVTEGFSASDLGKCLAVPPYYLPASDKGALGAPLAVSQSLDQLRKLGADFFIFVDVLGQQELISSAESASYWYWHSQRGLWKAQSRGFDHVVSVATAPHALTAWEKRRELYLKGFAAGQKAARDLSERFGF